MQFDLATMTKRAGKTRRPEIVLPEIVMPRTLAVRLDLIYVRVLRMWSEGAKNKLLPDYAASLGFRDGMVRDDAADLQRDLETIAAEIAALIASLEGAVTGWAEAVEAYHRRRWGQIVLTRTGVDIDVLMGPQDVAETLGDVIARNVALIKDVSAQAQGRISDIVFRGLTARTRPREVAKQINEAVGLGRDRSRRIAADQLTKLATELDRARATQAELTEFIWRHSEKLHFRPVHKARNGNRYKYRGDPRLAGDFPGQLPYCGCRAQAFIDLDDE